MDTYKGEVAFNFSEAWKLAGANIIRKAQQHQKKQYDRKTRLPRFEIGDRVFVYMPAAKACKAYKFARPFHGPYRIVERSETGVVVRPVDRPQADPIRVAYNRIRCCADSIPDLVWPTRARVTGATVDKAVKQTADAVSGIKSAPSKPGIDKTKRQLHGKGSVVERAPGSVIWRSRLRPRNTGVVA